MSVCTPRSVVALVKAVFGGIIDLDPCDHPDSVVGAVNAYRLPERDGLELDWWGRTYVNPPWGYDYLTGAETLTPWLSRCRLFHKIDRTMSIIAYVPTAPHTPCWDRHVFPAATAICFAHEPATLESKYGALGPVHTSFLYYGSNPEQFRAVFSTIGNVLKTS